MRILHFSDVHLGLKDFHPGYLLDKRLFGRINQFVTRQRHLSIENLDKIASIISQEHIDCAVCTGDLASIGSPEEFSHAQMMLDNIRKSVKGHFFYVPGNHDAYVKQYHNALRQIFGILNGNQVTLDELPAAINCQNVQFILLNPARPCKIWQSTGELTPAAWEKMDYILSTPVLQGQRRILLSHFPLLGHLGTPLSWRTKFIGGTRLLPQKGNAMFDAMLTGHVHHPFIHLPTTAHPLLVGAGSLTIQNSYAIVDVPENGDITATIHHLHTT